MSALPSSSPVGVVSFRGRLGESNLPVQVKVDLGGVLAGLGSLLPAVSAAMGWRMYALTNHHIRSVAANNLAPNKRGFQKLIFALAYNYGRKVRDVKSLADVQGESFLASREADILQQFEFGANVRASSPFTVPFPGQRKKLRRLIEQGGKRRPVLINTRANKAFLIKEIGKEGRRNYRTELLGWVRDKRRQRPILGFYSRFDSVFERDVVTFDKALDAVVAIIDRVAAETPSRPVDAAGVAAAFAKWESENRTRVPTYRQAKAAREAAAASKALDSAPPIPKPSGRVSGGGTGGGA